MSEILTSAKKINDFPRGRKDGFYGSWQVHLRADPQEWLNYKRLRHIFQDNRIAAQCLPPVRLQPLFEPRVRPEARPDRIQRHHSTSKLFNEV